VSKLKPRLPRHRGRWVASLALLAVAAVVVVIVVSNNKPSTGGSVAGTTATGAATVQRRNLVATDTESGTLSYAGSQTVYNRLSGTITWVPAVGRVIHAGQTLFDVDNKPVMLMDGATPAYRELSSTDVSGPDVYELNKNLVDLGYDPDGIVVDDEWQDATTAGIDELQYRLGATETGSLTLGQVVFLPGPQMVQTVDTTVGSTAASYTPTESASQPLFVDYSKDATTTGTDTTGTTGTTSTGGTDTTGTDTTGTGTDTTGTDTTGTGTTTPTTGTTKTSTTVNGGDNLSKRTLKALLRLIRQQQRELQAEQRASHTPTTSKNSGTPKTNKNAGKPKSSTNSGTPKSNNTGGGSTGGGGSGGGGSAVAVLATSSTKLVVTVDLSASSQSEATIGEKVSVEMPNGGTVGGRVTAVSPVAQSSSSDDNGDDSGGAGAGGGGSGSSTVPVTIVLDKRANGGGLDQASVSVNFVQSKAKHVLSVPVTALLATSGSTFAVQEASGPHKLIPVQTGLFAAGFVEISGSGIYPGLKVTDSQG
jgi:hypothetical protein